MADTVEIKEGSTFAVEVSPERTIDQVRADALEKYGRAIHVSMKVGPFTTGVGENGGTELGFPIAAIDDKVLMGAVTRFPQKPGHYVLIGRFL